MHPLLFEIGPLRIPSYGAFGALGMLLVVWLSVRAGRRQGVDAGTVLDLSFWILFAAIAGAWALNVALNANYYWTLCVEDGRCLAAVQPATAGYVFYGGFVAGLLALIGFARRRRLDRWLLADVVAVNVPIGHALGRVGCFFAGCCYGTAAPPGVGVLFPAASPASASGLPVHATQLYEAVALAALFVALRAFAPRKPFQGAVALSYLGGYAAIRFVVELFRGDARGALGPLSTSQAVALGAMTLAVVLWIRRPSGGAKAATAPRS